MRKYVLTVPLLALFILTGCNENSTKEETQVAENSKDTYLLKNEVDRAYFSTYKEERDNFYKDNCEKEFNKSKDKTFANIKNRIVRSNCVIAFDSIELQKAAKEAKRLAREAMEKSEKEQEKILKKFN